MKTIDKEYEKHIRFYLDTLFSNKIPVEQDANFEANPSKKFKNYILEFSGNNNYLFSYPMSVFWNLTSACNFRCVHCLYNDTKYSSQNDLSTEDIMSLADELINFDVTYVVLSGGELFVHPEAMNLIKKLKSNNIAVRILTNGALLNDSIIIELAKIFNPYTDSVDISLDASTFETFQQIRKTDCFNTITDNIKKLSDKNIKVTAVCTANKINYKEITETYKLANKLGVYNFIVGKMSCYNDSHKELELSDRELLKLYYELYPLSASLKTILEINFFAPIEILNIPELAYIIKENKYQNLIKKYYTEIRSRSCHKNDKIAISANGTIYLCLEALVHNIAPLGNYRKNSFAQIWENRWSNILFEQRKIKDMVCNDCKYNTFCNSGCLVQAYLKTRNIHKPQIPNCAGF